MSNKTIPDLSAASALADADLIIISQGGVTKKLVGSVVRNADKVDTFHASATPTASTIPVTAAGGNLATGWLPNISFSVHKDGVNQDIEADTSTLLTFSTEDFDVGGCFADNVFTPTVAGKYQINLFVSCSPSSDGLTYIEIHKNDALYASSAISHAVAAVNETHSLSVVIDMNGTTDYLSVKAYMIDGGGIVGDATDTRFSGHYIDA